MMIYEALKEGHRTVQSLLDQLVTSSKSGGEVWKATVDQIREELIPHARAEEAVFYNALREIDETKGLVAHSYQEHVMAETELRTLGAAKMVDANWTSLMEKLRNDINHHIQEEEGKIFTAAKRVFSDEEARQIGEAFQKLKLAVAKDADSMTSSTIDLVANLMPRRLVSGFRKHIGHLGRSAA